MNQITNKPQKLLLASLFFALFNIWPLHAQQRVLQYDDYNYIPEVQSVEFYQKDNPLSDPVLRLHEMGKLLLAFDILGDMAYTFDFTIIHCNRDWTPSALRPQEYIDGFTDDRITNFAFSQNTITPYVHYTLTFPSSQLRPKLSGNYLLVVYLGSQAQPEYILSRRFMVVDALVPIEASVAPNTRLAGLNRTHQMLNINLTIPPRFSGLAREAFSLDIYQNNRRDNAVLGLIPSNATTGKLTFEYLHETTFAGANQWRNFDIKNFRYQSERIQRITEQPDGFLVKLWPDKPRHQQPYKSELDINGRRLIRARPDQQTETEGDYAWVEFLLPFNAPLTHQDIFVVGQLTDWKLTDKNKMTYNYGLKAYELSLLLKQGYYNYLYVLYDRQTGTTSTAEIEGNFWDTQNKYTLVLYVRHPGSIYDQIAGYLVIDAH